MSPAKIYSELLQIKQILATDNLATPRAMAQELGITLKTLQNWKSEGKMEGCYTYNRGGQIMYDRAKVKDIRL